MTKEFLLEALEKQVNLISECSEKCAAESDAHGLVELSSTLIAIASAWSAAYL